MIADIQLKPTPTPAKRQRKVAPAISGDIDLSRCLSIDRAVEILRAHHGGTEGLRRVFKREGLVCYQGRVCVVRLPVGQEVKRDEA